MKITKYIAAVASSLLVISATAVPVTTVQHWVYYGLTGGGEITVTGSPWGNSPPYAPQALASWLLPNATGFQTFCLERNEGLVGITEAMINPNHQAVLGGTTFFGGPNPDPISRATAWLYSEFARGTLAGYDYSAAGRQASAGALQDAIWFLEKELGAVTTGAAFVTAAQAISNWSLDANGDFNVRVLNMFGPDSSGALVNKQDFLVLVPDGGATLALLGFAITGLGLIRRKI